MAVEILIGILAILGIPFVITALTMRREHLKDVELHKQIFEEEEP